MRKPASPDGKANSTARYLVGAGFAGAARVPGKQGRVLAAPLALAVYGHKLPHRATGGQVLAALAREQPGWIPVLVRCVDPEIEGAWVTLRLDHFAALASPRREPL